VEWRLLQQGPGLADVEDDADLAPGNNSAVRRYEFYEYTGGYDPDDHQALCDTPDQACVGNYIGAQIVEGVLVTPEPRSIVLIAVLIAAAIVISRRRHAH